MYCDSHVEFIHPKSDLKDIDPLFLSKQINPALINKIKPELLFLAAFVLPGKKSWKNLVRVINSYLETIQSNGWILIKSEKDLYRKGIKVILHIEDLSAVGQDLKKIDRLYELGTRSIGLTHNQANQFAGGVLSSQGLTKLGKKAIRKILSLGIILDLAHLNEKSFFEVINLFNLKPFVSHAGIFSCFCNPRNVKDSVLKAIKINKGYVGIGFAGSFFAKKSASRKKVLAQIEYAIKMAGNKRVGIGSDFGGITSFLPNGLKNIGAVADINIPIETMGKNLLDFVKKHFRKI